MTTSQSSSGAFSNRPEDIGPPPRQSSWTPLVFFGVLAAAALVALVILAGRNREQIEMPSGADHRLVGQRLPHLKLAPLTGDPPPLDESSLKGQVTLINLWGTWCGPCLEEFPHMMALRESLSDEQDFRLVSVSCGMAIEPEDEIDDLRERTELFLERMDADLPTYYDPEGVTRLAYIELQGNSEFGLPLTLLLDREGVIRGVWPGYFPGMEGDVEQVTRQVLEEPSRSE